MRVRFYGGLALLCATMLWAPGCAVFGPRPQAAGVKPAKSPNLSAASETAPEVLWRIGKVDGSPAEFGLVRETYQKFSECYSKPVVFTVGESKLAAWPYVHPSSNDLFAGNQPHTFTIRFQSERAVDGPLVLSLGLAGSWERSLATVTVNGQALPARRMPHQSTELVQNPRGAAETPSTEAFEIPAGAVVAGDNSIEINLDRGSWILYDFVCLAPEAVKYAPPGLKADALDLGVEEVIFAVRQPGKDGHWYANFSYYAADENRLTYGNGGRLCRLNLRTGDVRALLEDAEGAVRDPQLHYDGKKILFSYRKGGSLNYHLYEINIDGAGLRQLTDGGYDDIEPTYLPDGGIVFCSSRCKRWVNCWLVQVAVLYRCDADGGNLRAISSNNEPENTPWVLPDGRILYQRWEYVDRSQVHYHHLWTTNPDGTNQTIYYGNQNPGIVMIDAKPIPETNEVLAIFSPGHGRREHEGVLTVLDPRGGPDDRSFARTLNAAGNFRDPYPLSRDRHLVARGTQLLLMDGQGRPEPIYELPKADAKAGLQVHEPRPLRPRLRERVIAPRGNPREKTGRLFLTNIYEGRNMEGVKPGEIKKLLIMETLPKPINFTGGMEPLSYGGTFTLERVCGTVPVEADGSAYLELPALRSFFFVALDENDLSVKRMQSFLTVQPGEVQSCVGCHEQRTRTTLPNGNPLAARRPASRIEPIADVPDVLDFPRDIQPILNRHCTGCHGYEKTPQGGPHSKGVILTADRGPLFSHSYFSLSAREQLGDGRNRAVSNYPPRGIGSSASPLMQKILKGHNGVALTARERKTVRLWIDSGAPYPGTYGALGAGMIGGYEENQIDRSDTKWPSIQAATKVYKGRCAECHTGKLRLPESPSDNMGMPPWAVKYGDPRLRFSRHILYNLSRPEKSLLLLAPLAKDAGGYGICRPLSELKINNDKLKKGGKERIAADGKKSAGAELGEEGEKAPPVFADTDDPDYQLIFAAVRVTKARLEEVRRFDMPGFVPRKGYLREMRRYGILADAAPDQAIDPYALDRAYWESLWHRP